MNILRTAVVLDQTPTFNIHSDEIDQALCEYVTAHSEALKQLEYLPPWTPLVRIVNQQITITTVGEYLAPVVYDSEDDIPF